MCEYDFQNVPLNAYFMCQSDHDHSHGISAHREFDLDTFKHKTRDQSLELVASSTDLAIIDLIGLNTGNEKLSYESIAFPFPTMKDLAM